VIRAVACLLVGLIGAGAAGAMEPAGAGKSAPKLPPGFNVHSVAEAEGRRFLRGGAPRKDTLEALVRDARARGVTLTLVDLRHPANSDDRSGKGGRLSPKQEQAAAAKLGARYVSISALDKEFTGRLQQWRKAGDVYLHCMYGVNRTGFAVARYARAEGAKPSRTGLGKRDWAQGERFEAARRR
jgi:hypothetical protein